MKVLPSTSVSRAPEARLMKSGAAPTDLKARTGLSTPPGRIRCARAKSAADLGVRNRTALSLLRDGARGVAGVISNDDVGTGAADARERFEHRPLLVDPSITRGGLQHRVLAADVIRRGGIAEGV